MPLFFYRIPMLFERINAWLTAADDYEAGLALLRETGYSGFALTVLMMGEDAHNRKRLDDELRKWVMLNPQTRIPVTVALDYGVPDAKVIVVPAVKPASEPMAVMDLRQRTYQLLDERAELKARIRARMDDEGAAAQGERRDWAFRIKAITRELDELYSQIDFYAQYGYLPPVATDPTVDVDDTAQLLNVRSYVSRYKAKLKKKNLTPEQRQSYQKLLTDYEHEKQRLELKLKKHDTHSTGQQTTDCPNHSPALPPA